MFEYGKVLENYKCLSEYFNSRRQKTAMFEIYEDIIRLDNNVNDYGISPLAYVVLDCGR